MNFIFFFWAIALTITSNTLTSSFFQTIIEDLIFFYWPESQWFKEAVPDRIEFSLGDNLEFGSDIDITAHANLLGLDTKPNHF